METTIQAMDLSLFDGEGAGAAAPGDGSTAAQAAAVPGKGKTGDKYANVRFGRQGDGATATGTVTNAQEPPRDAGGEENAEVQVTSNTLEERRKAFRDLVSGEFKDIYTEETQRMLNRRFGEVKQMETKLNDQQGVIDLLMQRYHIDDGDLGKLTAALDSDDAYWSAAAEEAGMTVEQYKQFQQLQRENEALHRAQEGRQEQERVQRQAQQWFQEAQEVARKFKGFDLSQELQNPQFVAMLRAGTPVEHAYKVMHFDELMGSAMQVTAAHTEKAVADNVRARGTRPAENGASTQSAFTVKDDPSRLTRADFEEIARRVARGEIISF